MLALDFSTFPLFHTARLNLRQILVNDVNEIISLRSNKEAMKYIDKPLIDSEKEALQLIQKITDGINSNEAITWAITLQNDDLLVGTIGFWRIDKEHHRAEIGYMLHPDYWNTGLMTEALSKTIDFGFNKMNLHSIEAIINPDNTVSRKILQKFNFIKEAYFKENFFFEGEFFDSEVYSLLGK